MSYICNECGETIERGIVQLKKIVERRETKNGWEIKKEKKMCPSCYGIKPKVIK